MTTRVAVIGVGMMGRNHARVYADLPDVELVGVADASEQVAETVARKYRCASYTNYLALLDELAPDAVTIAVPTVEHLNVALEAIRRGIHVLIEKPISYSVEQGEDMIAAAKVAGVQLMVGHIERFNPAVVALKERLLAGELGRVFQIDARRQGPFPARVSDVGVVIDLAVHDVDVMRYITGSEVVRISAETENRIHTTNEDLLVGLLRLDDGTVGTLTINWLTPTKIRELYVTGERGMFRIDYLTQDLYFYENATTTTGDWEALRVLRGVSEGRMIRHVVAKQEPLRSEQEMFLKAVRGEAPVAVTGEDGLMALALAQAIVTSGREHRFVIPQILAAAVS
jgi:UDP-N-acetylglucosamine 3-dehydrogenase